VKKSTLSKSTTASLLAVVACCCLVAPASASSGTLRIDRSFGNGGVVRSAAVALPLGFDRSAVAVDTHDRLLALGANSAGFTVSRYLPGGRLDRSFSRDGAAEVVVPGLARSPTPEEGKGGAGEPQPTALALQADGDILLAGTYDTDVGGSAGLVSVVARLRPNGAADPSFGDGEAPGQATYRLGSILAIAIQGKRILIAGRQGSGYVARLDRSGNLDSSFGERRTGRIVLPPPDRRHSRRVVNGAITALIVRPDGSLYAGGYDSGRFLLTRLLRDGSLDHGFGVGGIVTTQLARRRGCGCSFAHGLARDRRGRLLLVGTVSSSLVGRSARLARVREPTAIALARYRADGSLDRSFGAAGIVRTQVGGSALGQDVAVTRGGTIFVAGTSTRGSSAIQEQGRRFTVLRYAADGSRRGLFASRLGATGASATDAVLDRAGRIVVAGTETSGPPRRVQGVLARFLTAP
jgi:uncharacterized delta-60 repeat protein